MQSVLINPLNDLFRINGNWNFSVEFIDACDIWYFTILHYYYFTFYNNNLWYTCFWHFIKLPSKYYRLNILARNHRFIFQFTSRCIGYFYEMFDFLFFFLSVLAIIFMLWRHYSEMYSLTLVHIVRIFSEFFCNFYLWFLVIEVRRVCEIHCMFTLFMTVIWIY